MAAPFLGLNVHVKLKNPPSSLHGHVANVDGQRLYLRDVYFLRSGKTLKEYTLHGAEIEDIEVLPAGINVEGSRPEVQHHAEQTISQNIRPSMDTHHSGYSFRPNLPLQKPSLSKTPSENAPERVISNHMPTLTQPLLHTSYSHHSLQPPKVPQPSFGLLPAQLGPLTRQPFIDPAIVAYEPTSTQGKVELGVPSPTAPTNLVGGEMMTVHLVPDNHTQLPTQLTNQPGNFQDAAPVSAISMGGPVGKHHFEEQTTPASVAATLSRPFDVFHTNDRNDHTQRDSPKAINHNATGAPFLAEAEVAREEMSKAARRKKKKTGPTIATTAKMSTTATDGVESSPEHVLKPQQRADSAGKGWRETPLLQEQNQGNNAEDSTHRGPGSQGATYKILKNNGNRKGRHNRALQREADKNGWATEDATDVQGMGDFDFVGNLSKFDKKSVWEELRNEDTTADEDRLISFNRVKAPGTFGGQKLHPTENVLGRTRTASHDYDSDSEVDPDNAAINSVRQLRRNQSQSRKGSFKTGAQSVSPAPTSSNRLPVHSKQAQPQQLSDVIPRSYSPRNIQGYVSPTSSSFSRSAQHSGGLTQNQSQTYPMLRYSSTGQSCRSVPPETLLAIENLSHNGFALQEDLLAENAAHGIAQVVLSAIDPGGHRLGQRNHNSSPIVVVLVGESTTGARALAASRHLIERGVRVLASLTGQMDLENGPLRLQVQRFRGKVIRSWEQTSAALKKLDAPPELIIDAVLGVHDSFETMSSDHFAISMEMMGWANRSRASVLSIDIPSGIDPLTGAVEIHEGEPREIRAKMVVCCGIPCTGLVEAMALRGNEQDWRVSVVDIGINPAARPFMKVNTNQSEGSNAVSRGRFIEFGMSWVLGLKFDAGSTTS